MKYKEGDIVSVKVSGLIVSGIIKEKKNTGEYIVQFDGGAEQLVVERSIKPLDTNMPMNEILNSPSRRSPSRRSPARAASPSRRAKVKSPSPSRRKSPSRKSPSRILKVSLENIEAKESSPVHVSFPRRRKPIEHTEEVSKFQSVTEITKVFTIKNGFEPSTFSKDTVQVDKEEDKILHLKQPTYLLEDLSNFSDGEVIETTTTDAPEKLRKSEPKPVFPPREFGGWFGALLLMILMPTFVLAMHVFCNRDFCSYVQLPDLQQYKFVGTFFDLHAAYLYFGYIALIALLNKIPFGGKKITSMPSNYKKQIYRMNGLFSIFVVHAIIVALEYYNVPIVNTLYEKYFQLLCTAIVFGLSFSTVVYFKSKFVPLSCLNSHGFTNNPIYDFFIGREIHPKVLGIDIKMLLFRSSLIAVIAINSIFIFKSMDVNITTTDNMLSVSNITYDHGPSLLVSSMLQIFYVFDIFFFESAMASSFELQSEGIGYFSCMKFSLYPFMLTAITKYFYEYESAVCPWLLLSVCILFFLGYVLFRGANSQKNAFRRNPYDPALAYLETMSTSQGKKLLISGYWGLVRHPNYIGDILIHLAIGALCVTSPAALGALPSTILLVHRASRIDARCKRRYGSYWDRYCQKVKYQLIPKIY